jgi:hypothetical protein
MNIDMGENTIKEVTMGVDNDWNCNLDFLENHKGSTIIWIVNFVCGVSSIIWKVLVIKIWYKLMMFQELFCMFKTFQICLWTFFFFQMSFSCIKCA